MNTATRAHERRIRPLELREAVEGSNGRQRWATAVTYRTVDDYGTMWAPDVFTDSLAERMPTILYGHDWYSLDHVLGTGIDSREMNYGVDVLMEFADPVKVPPAGRAIYLVEKRIITDVSVGFTREEWRSGKELTPEEVQTGALEVIVKAAMDELSLVIRGAVLGASIRSRRGAVALDDVVEIARRIAAVDLAPAEGEAAIALLDLGEAPPDVVEVEEAAEVIDQVEDLDDSTVQAALDLVADRSRRR